jgi:hypothetical protein
MNAYSRLGAMLPAEKVCWTEYRYEVGTKYRKPSAAQWFCFFHQLFDGVARKYTSRTREADRDVKLPICVSVYALSAPREVLTLTHR